jgi:hypothetical protein
MNQAQRALLAMAMAIRDDLGRRQCRDTSATKLPLEVWTDLVRITQRIQLAHDRGWHLAAAALGADQLTMATYVQQRVETWVEGRRRKPTVTRGPETTDLYRDLLGLDEEFGEVKYDSAATELIVTTSEIVLEEIDLGRFEIRLAWSAADEHDASYRIVALNPHPAARNQSVTHPHVQDERLCPGEGRTAIEKALDDGRTYDFFLIVNQILHTYSQGSAFVELEDWDQLGYPCRDCGCETDEDSRSHCESCSGSLCGDCVSTCCGCGYDFCSGCITTCPHCDDYFCRPCRATCHQCNAAVCRNCLETETLCKRCHEREQADAADVEPALARPA